MVPLFAVRLWLHDHRNEYSAKENKSFSRWTLIYTQGFPSHLNISSVATWLSLLTLENSKTPIRAKISSSHVSLKVALACCFTRSREFLYRHLFFQQFPLSCCGQAKARVSPEKELGRIGPGVHDVMMLWAGGLPTMELEAR